MQDGRPRGILFAVLSPGKCSSWMLFLAGTVSSWDLWGKVKVGYGTMVLMRQALGMWVLGVHLVGM